MTPGPTGSPPTKRSIGPTAAELRATREPKAKKESLEIKAANSKTIDFSYLGPNSTWKVGRFIKLPDETRYLMSLGKLNTRALAECIKTKEDKETWLLKMLNKGRYKEDDTLDLDDLSELADSCIEQGYVTADGEKPELTQAGIDRIKSTIKGRKKW